MHYFITLVVNILLSLDWVDITPRERTIWGLSDPLKNTVVSTAVYAAKGIIQSSITARLAMRPFVDNMLG